MCYQAASRSRIPHSSGGLPDSFLTPSAALSWGEKLTGDREHRMLWKKQAVLPPAYHALAQS